MCDYTDENLEDNDVNSYGPAYKSEDSAYTTDEWYDFDPDEEQ